MSTNLKIAVIVPYKVYPAKMGGQKAIALFYQYLNELIPVNIISVSNSEKPAGTGFYPLLNKSKLRYINLFLFPKMKRWMKENKITHLMIEHPYMGWLGLLLKRSLRVPLIVRSHNIEALRFKSIGKWWWGILWNYEKFIHRHADESFFITDEDREFAIKNYKLHEAKCHTITYGSVRKNAVSKEEKAIAKKMLQSRHQLSADEKILLFNGTLDYQPNTAALDIILTQLNPLLLKNKNFRYRVIICGNNLPAVYDQLKDYQDQHIIYAGFVENIEAYFNGADIFINPVTGGGGIKTKLVEALGAGLSCVSTVSGAIGVPSAITGNKMKMVADADWADFAEKIIHTDTGATTPAAFFNHFYWGNIAMKAANILTDKTAR